MRSLMILAALSLAATASIATPANTEDYRHGRLLSVEPGVSLQRASGVGAEEADTNEPFLPGDRVWTNAAGRAEFQFADGSLLRLDRRSKLDYAGHEEEAGERVVLRLWSGSLYARARQTRLEIETPAGFARGLERSLVRVDVEAGEVRFSVYEGEGVFDDGRTALRLAAGERTYAQWGGAASEPERFDLHEADDFDRWNADQEAQHRWYGRSAEYLPDQLDPYAAELDAHGDWRHEGTVGYVWVPRVEVGWRPYWHGRWCWTPFGWTWVPYERWGWAPFHYGRWGHASFGWYWIPGRRWGPAWVSWAVGGGYVGWCPLGSRDRPVRGWHPRRRVHHPRGHAVPRGRQIEPWSVVRHGELGRRDLARRRLSPERIDPRALAVGASARHRPTRDAMRLREASTSPRSLRTRPVPGDFVRELAVDNKRLPAPWFHRDRTTTRGPSRLREQRARTSGSASAARPRAEMGAGARSSERNSLRRTPASGERTVVRPWTGQAAAPRASRRAPQARSSQRAPQARSSSRRAERQQRSAPAPRVESHERSRGNSAPRARPQSGSARSSGGETRARSRGSSQGRSRGSSSDRSRGRR